MATAPIIACAFLAALLLPLLLYHSSIPIAHHSNRRLKQLPSTAEEGPRRDDEDVSNVTRIVAKQFREVDVDHDGSLSRHELIHCNLRHIHRESLHRSKRAMHLYDKNHDGFVSFSEYYPPSRLQNGGTYGYGDMGWWKEDHFNASDADGDGRLNLTEFNDFRNPADSKSPRLRQWLCKEELRERDTDRDGKINFQEFLLGLFDLARKYDEESTQHCEGSRDARARALFAQLDKDGDRYLSHPELLPIIGKIYPSECYYAKQQADYIISRDDADKDGRLTLTEFMKSYRFYMVMYNEYEDEYDSHDES